MARKKRSTSKRKVAISMPKFRSNFERTTSKDLDSYGLAWSFESESIPYTSEHTYTPDFIIPKKDGGVMMIETKGHFSSRDRAKHLCILKQHPELDIRFIFMRGRNTLNSRSNTTYLEWCEKRGIPCADVKIPSEWVDECKIGRN